ncbi:Cellobiose dehydrogenase, cytochrome [Metarhizium rileyi]|uniref:Cellobiose dehydrogenase, cytochrome n=1 Tax=Metarhizium rileyi (strain RCEF 4871) TaxID=1649241 RepID=A0A167AW91_METRR|nr:Cellobiose dehydrogenase, cytochrome [Metarhizium rileyi RCEF 4871]
MVTHRRHERPLADGGPGPTARKSYLHSDKPSTRKTTTPEVTDNFKARPIATSTSVKSSSLTYTFLCEECLDEALGLVATAATRTAKMGWALGSNKVENSASPAAMLNFHHLGFGGFQAQLAEARSAQFDQWATMAGVPLAPAAGASLIESEKKKKKEKKEKGKAEIKGGLGKKPDDDSDDDD